MKDILSDILDFWFHQSVPAQWFQKNPDFDDMIRTRYLRHYEWARDGLYDGWMRNADGCLALCVLLDQFPRNMFRGLPEIYVAGNKSVFVARHAVHKGYDQIFTPEKRRFFYLPFEHSEKLDDQKESLRLFEKLADHDPLAFDYAKRRYNVIARFGRFPHRNAILGRESTPYELDYLATPQGQF